VAALNSGFAAPLQVRNGLAEFERELIKARTAEGRERAKGRGVRMGRKPARESLATYCFGFASGDGVGAAGSAVGVVPRSSDAAAHSPAQSLVPLTVPTSLQPIGSFGFT
jgi:hypothetical protein